MINKMRIVSSLLFCRNRKGYAGILPATRLEDASIPPAVYFASKSCVICVRCFFSLIALISQIIIASQFDLICQTFNMKAV